MVCLFTRRLRFPESTRVSDTQTVGDAELFRFEAMSGLNLFFIWFNLQPIAQKLK